MAIEDDTIDYSAASVREALELWADGTPDPDPDRRADLNRAFRQLPLNEATALACHEAGWTLSAISMWVYGKSHPMYASRLLAHAFDSLRTSMNGGRIAHGTTGTDRGPVLRQDHAS